MQNRKIITLTLALSMALSAATPSVFAETKTYKIAPAGLTDYQINYNLISQAAKKSADKKADDASNKDKKADPKKVEKEEEEEDEKEPVLTNVIPLTTETLVEKAKDYMGKNIKFKADFFAFSNLALNYKPAMRPQKKYISLLVYRPKSKVPFSELKLAMKIPKEKDPKNKMLTSLQDGDTVEITGNVFSTALDETWVDVLQLKKLKSAKKDKSDDKKADKSEKSK